MVAGKIGGVDLESGDGASISELDDTPVVGGVVAASLPAIVPGAGRDEATRGGDGGGGGEEVLSLGEPLVGKGENLASAGGNSEIYMKLNMDRRCGVQVLEGEEERWKVELRLRGEQHAYRCTA